MCLNWTLFLESLQMVLLPASEKFAGDRLFDVDKVKKTWQFTICQHLYYMTNDSRRPKRFPMQFPGKTALGKLTREFCTRRRI